MTRKKIQDRETKKFFTGFQYTANFSQEIRIQHPLMGPYNKYLNILTRNLISVTGAFHNILSKSKSFIHHLDHLFMKIPAITYNGSTKGARYIGRVIDPY